MPEHDHVSGRPRNYISRKWFHRARHRPTDSSSTVDELVEAIGMEIDNDKVRGFPITKNQQYYVWRGPVTVHGAPFGELQAAYITVPPGISEFPPLITDAKQGWHTDER